MMSERLNAAEVIDLRFEVLANTVSKALEYAEKRCVCLR